MPKRRLPNKRVSSEFLSQGAAVDAENSGSLALVALRVIHDRLEQGPLNFADDEIVQIAGPVAVHRCEILVERVFSVFAKRFLADPGREVVLVVLFLGHVA